MSPPLTEASNDHRPDLGARGVVAVLTPAENPTVEPEFSVLAPPDVNLLTARMHSPASDMFTRLKAYETQLDNWLAPFGDAPLDAIAFACTGSSYLVAPEDRHPGTLQRTGGSCPVVGAAGSIDQALQSLQARRIILVSPYPAALTAPAKTFWAGRGYDIVEVAQAPEHKGGGHPIYSRTAQSLLTAMRQADRLGPSDAIIALGTGAPSLPALAVASLETDTPILSSNLATVWALSNALSGRSEPFKAWLNADAPWRERLWTRFPATHDRLRDA